MQYFENFKKIGFGSRFSYKHEGLIHIFAFKVQAALFALSTSAVQLGSFCQTTEKPGIVRWTIYALNMVAKNRLAMA